MKRKSINLDDVPTRKDMDFQPRSPEETRSSYLITMTTANQGASGNMHRLGKDEIIIGRSSASDILIDEEGVSRQHAKILLGAGPTLLVDLSSTNGTLINGVPIEQAPLNEGDKIQIGPMLYKFTVQDSLDEAYHKQLLESAIRDPLTTLHNRRYFIERLDSEVAHAIRYKSTLALAIFDLDFFKEINDSHGHAAGDEILRLVAKAFQIAARAGDIVARIGGEEFAVLLRDTPRDGAIVFAERLRQAIQELSVPWKDSTLFVTVSAGISVLDGSKPVEPMTLLHQADDLLYTAKRKGRNQLVYD